MRAALIPLAAVIVLSAGMPVPERIAFNRVGAQAGQPQLFIAASDSSDEHPLLPNRDADYDAVWAPDGAALDAGHSLSQ